MPGDKIRELLRATLPTGTGDIAYDVGKEGLKDMTPQKALDMLQQFSPGGMQVASITKLLERDLASGGKLLKPFERKAAELARQWFPDIVDIADETHVVPPAKYEETLKQYADKLGMPKILQMLKGQAITIHRPEGQTIVTKGMSRDTLHEMANLLESFAHEGQHAGDWVNKGARPYVSAASEAKAYPKGWQAARKLLEHYKLDPNSVVPQIPDEYIPHLSTEDLSFLRDRSKDQNVLQLIAKEFAKRRGAPPKMTIGYDNLGRKIEQIDPEWVKKYSAGGSK